MGAYLSEPVTEKHSVDEANEYLQVGASSMQGWRISQEDAHNCILKLNDNISYFAVYDGHGGAEVAKYCSEKLPEFLKELQFFKDGNFEEALKEAFLKFDSTLLKENVIEELKKIADERNPAESNSEVGEDEEEEDLAALCQEGSLPLEKVLAKYKENKGEILQVSKLRSEEIGPGSSGTSKPLSPRLRGRRNANKCFDNEATTSFPSEAEPSSTANLTESNDDQQVSSTDLNSVTENNEKNNEMKSTEAVSTSEETLKVNGESHVNCNTQSASSSSSTKNNSPDSSISNSVKQDKVQNGDIKAETSSGVSSSSLQPWNIIEESSSSEEYESPEEDESLYSEESEEIFDADEEEAEDDWMFKERYANEKFCANMVEEPGKDSGCTAVVALLNGRDLYVANAGDSRCVVCRAGKAIDMSIDHKPEDKDELKRIVKAGGTVTLDGRVNGGLNLSRAIGDHAYKMNASLPPEEQMISALPEVRKLILDPKDEFMILACDGIWNYMSSEEVVELVKEFIDEKFDDMSAICEELLNTCLAPSTIGDGTGCDNMTAIIIRFKPSIFEQPTKLNPDHCIKICNQEKKITETETKSNEANEAPKKKAKKRSVSSTVSENLELSSTTASTCESEEQSMKRFKSSVIPDSAISTTETCEVAIHIASSSGPDIIEEKKEQSQTDSDAAEADTAAASITTTFKI